MRRAAKRDYNESSIISGLEAVREFKVPLSLPPKEASPNGRYHWRLKAAAIQVFRGNCGHVFRVFFRSKGRLATPIVIDLDFYLCRKVGDKYSYYPKDEDNARASAKAAQDALVDAGVVERDSKKFVKAGRTTLHTRKREHKGRTEMVMTIREIV